MSMEMDALRVAERAADWLVRLDTASSHELAEFWEWLIESPLHVQEMLAAQVCHTELERMLKNGRVTPGKLAVLDETSTQCGSDDPPYLLRDALIKALRSMASRFEHPDHPRRSIGCELGDLGA